MAPVIRAGVMTANIIWKAKNAIPPDGNWALPAMSYANAKSKLPISEPPPPNAKENPITAQITLIRPIAKMFCISIPRMFFERTMPP